MYCPAVLPFSFSIWPTA